MREADDVIQDVKDGLLSGPAYTPQKMRADLAALLNIAVRQQDIITCSLFQPENAAPLQASMLTLMQRELHATKARLEEFTRRYDQVITAHNNLQAWIRSRHRISDDTLSRMENQPPPENHRG